MHICGDIKMEAAQVIEQCRDVPRREDVVKRDTAINPVWKPISHSNAVETMMTALVKHDIEVVDSAFALNRTGHLIVGGFQLRADCLPAMPDNVDGIYELFFRHANDMSLSLQINAGLSLFVCTNGMMNGQQIGRHKHIQSFNMQSWAMETAVPGFLNSCHGLTTMVDELREEPVSDGDAHRIILESAAQGVLPLARAVDVYRDWHNSPFGKDDFEPNTAFKLYNDFTHVAQLCSPQRQHMIVEKSYEFIMNNLHSELALAG